jgi:hypothetical protein
MAIERIFPTENDVATTSGDGRIHTEENLAWQFKSSGVRGIHVTSGDVYATSARSFVIQGLSPTDGGGLNLNVLSGKAIIEGFYVNVDATEVISLTPSVTRYIYLQLTTSGGLVTGAQWVQSTTADGSLTNAILIAETTTTGAAITTLRDERRFHPGVISGTYVGNSASSRDIDLTADPQLVIVSAEDYSIVAVSPPNVPRERGFANPPTVGGFYFVPSKVSLVSLDMLTSSTTWDPPLISASSLTSTTMTVNGAVSGDFCNVAHSALHSATGGSWDQLTLHAHVSAANTVTVYIHNHDSSNAFNIPSGTLRVAVLDASTEKTLAKDAFFSTAQDGKFVPFIVKNGFKVGYDGSNTNLNQSAKTYHYVAWL